MTSRSDLWERSRQLFYDQQILGIGFGVTPGEESLTDGLDTRQERIELGSSLWALLLQTGLCGFLPVMLGLVDLMFRSIRFTLAVRDHYFTTTTASVLGLFVYSFFEGWMVSPGGVLLFAMMLQCFVLDAITCRFQPPTRAAVPVRRIAATPEPTLY